MIRKKYLWHFVTAALSLLVVCLSTDVIEECKCTNYNDEYMYCNCCSGVKGYIFRFDYTYTHINSSESSNQTEVTGGKTYTRQCVFSIDSTQNCDCMFCGIIHDKSNPFYDNCYEQNPADKDFQRDRTYDLHITYLSADESDRGTFNHSVTTDDSILLPPPPSVDEWDSYLLPDQSVAMDISWSPSRNLRNTELNYTVRWRVLGDTFSEMVRYTTRQNITLTDLLPNRMYDINISCQSPASPYESDSVELFARSMERQPNQSPDLLNFLVDRTCIGEEECGVTLFWKAFPEEHQSSNCTRYLLSTSLVNHSASCNEVKAELQLSTLKKHRIELQYDSQAGLSPGSHLEIPVLEEVLSQKSPNAIIDRNESHVAIDVRWNHEGSKPTQYALMYCWGTATDKCQRDVEQEILTPNNNGGGTWWLKNPGDDFLYNIATYWQEQNFGLQESWLCVFDTCGELDPPPVVVSLPEEQQAESLALVIKEAACSAPQKDRGRPEYYRVDWNEEGSTQVHQEPLIEANGPGTLILEGLKPDQFYEVRVRSEGCNKFSLTTDDRFKTLEESSFLFPDWAIAVIVLSILLFVTATMGSVFWYYRRRQQNLKKNLALHNAEQKSGVLSWLEKEGNDFASVNGDDYSQVDPAFYSNKNKSADSDSGIENEEEDANKVCVCCSRTKSKHPRGEPEQVETQEVQIAMDLKAVSSFPSLSSHDSGQGDDSGSPAPATDQEIVLNASEWLGKQGDATVDDSLSTRPSPADSNLLESGITSYACQASPMSSVNGPAASLSDGRQPTGQGTIQQQDSNSTTAKANSDANAVVPGNNPEFELKDFDDNPAEFVPREVVVSCIDAFGETSEEDSFSGGGQKHQSRPNSDYLAMLNDDSSRLQETSNDSQSSFEDSDGDTDPDLTFSVIPTVNAGIINSAFQSKEEIAGEIGAVIDDISGDKNSIIAESERRHSLLSCQDDPQSQTNCSHEVNLNFKGTQQGSDCSAENSNSFSETEVPEGVDCHAVCDGETTGCSTDNSGESSNDGEDNEKYSPQVIVVKLPSESTS